MKIEFILKEEIKTNNELCCKIEITSDKKSKKDVKEMYFNKLVEAMQTKKKNVCFFAETILDVNDKKSIKFTTEAISETLFDIGWYFKDNDIDDNDFKVVIIAEDEITKELYRSECEKMGLSIL